MLKESSDQNFLERVTNCILIIFDVTTIDRDTNDVFLPHTQVQQVLRNQTWNSVVFRLKNEETRKQKRFLCKKNRKRSLSFDKKKQTNKNK